jgi:hypothetical protein
VIVRRTIEAHASPRYELEPVGGCVPHRAQIAYGRACTSTTPADGGCHSDMVWVVERSIPESWDP